MRTYVIGFWASLVLSVSSCTMKSTDGNDCNPVSNYLISDKQINSAMCGKLDIDQKSGKCFKVVISRRNTFLRVTVFQIINKEELSTFPSSYFKFYNSIFLCYDGSEILRNKQVADRVIDSLMPRMKVGYINDGPIFQLDIKEPGKKVEINDPAVNPYDFKEKPVTDTVSFSKRR
ncbi:hypothetical protein MTO98_10180 [Mucilaginibacter sp. SMC90]|uniref:hypothetical protein n=1 Tax=Mucilaginibacter sp. SMC90 TaxID=2929803 RepID=UPI001FB33D42|nr:hypothetical protein [Mucilaginibacter sp. SMC90]UOE51444.1 hypothetical protein MTO98_10180 [Mucilaginibacter sp. SMC90]